VKLTDSDYTFYHVTRVTVITGLKSLNKDQPFHKSYWPSSDQPYTLAKLRYTVDQHRRQLLAISISHISLYNGINALIHVG